MANIEKTHELLTFLLVDIKIAGAHMIELAGEINGLSRCNRDDWWKLDDLQEAVTKAQRSIDLFRKAVAAGKSRMTRKEFEAA